MLELLLEPLEAVAALLDERHLVAHPDEAAHEVRADLPTADDDDVHQAGASAYVVTASISARIARDGRADRAHAQRVVERRAARIEHAHDDVRDAEALLRDLRDDEVRVVAVGGDDDGVGVLHAGLAQHLGVHAVADDEAARPVLAQPLERLFLLVDGAHVPALGLQRFRARTSRPDRSR